VQIRWGLAAALLALAVVVVLAVVPDPFFRQTVYATTFDDVDAVIPGAPVYFRGAAVGSVRSIDLAPETRVFSVRLGVRRDWRPRPCTHAEIVESNPFTTPQIKLVALEVPPGACASARRAAACTVLAAPVEGVRGVAGCRRGPDLFETAAVAIAQAAEVATAANTMAVQVQGMMAKAGGGGPMPLDVNKLAADVTMMLATLNEMTGRLNSTLAPGRGDVALTLANVRRASGSAATLSDKAATIDVVRLNETLVELQDLVRQNQSNVGTLLSEGASLSVESRALLENVSASMNATTGQPATQQRESGGADRTARGRSDLRHPWSAVQQSAACGAR
jgi:hypothetical protein